MVTLAEYIKTTGVLLPVFSALACSEMLAGFSLEDSQTLKEKRHKLIVIAYMAVVVVVWSSIFCYGYFPRIFVWLNVPCLLSFVFVPILFYRIVYFLTYPDRERKFSKLHYLIPCLLGSILLVWSFFVPFEVQLQITEGHGQVFPAGYEAYARLFVSKPALRMVFGLIYYILTLLLLWRYYQEVKTPGSSIYKPERWVVFLIIVSVIWLFTSLIMILAPRARIFTFVWTYVGIACVILQHILITYSMIGRKYLPYAIYDRSTKTPDKKSCVRKQHAGKPLTRQRLEHYFRKEKPYLKQDLKITDIVTALDVNRSLVSGFINRTYGMNFNHYVNHWRLKELERLMKLPANTGKKPQKLLSKAGFTNNKHYLRARNMEQKHKPEENSQA